MPAKLQKISYFCPSINIKLLWGLGFLHRQLPVATGRTLTAPAGLGRQQQGDGERPGLEVLSCCVDKVRDPLVMERVGGVGKQLWQVEAGTPCWGQPGQWSRPLASGGEAWGVWWHSNALAKNSILLTSWRCLVLWAPGHKSQRPRGRRSAGPAPGRDGVPKIQPLPATPPHP